MNSWNKDFITNLLLEAGKIALHYYGSHDSSLKRDGTIVTTADIEIESLFTRTFDRPENNSFLLGEETGDQKDSGYFQRALMGDFYIVDPIDGTVSYANRLPNWGISIGLAKSGILTEGAIYLPATQEIFISENDEVFWFELKNWNSTSSSYPFQRIRVHQQQPYSTAGLIAVTQEMAKSGEISLTNPVHAICCAVMPLAYLTLGRYQAYFANLKLWDLAGGFPLLEKLGFEATFVTGEKMDTKISKENYNLDHGAAEQWKICKPCLFSAKGTAEHILSEMKFPL
jgi:myo-inositol-1(or 4)-monophosphatase